MVVGVNELAERKRQLLARSEIYRQSISIEVDQIRRTTAWIPRTIHVARVVAPLLMFAVPLAGALFGRKRTTRKRALGGIASNVLAGVRLFRWIKPLWDGVDRRKT